MNRPAFRSLWGAGLAPALIGLAFMGACTETAPVDDDGGSSTATTTTGGGAMELTSPHISDAEMSRMVSFLASDDLAGRTPGTPGSQAARDFIIAEMQRCNIQPAVNGGYNQPITTGAGTNIIGIIPGTDPALADRHVIISAHYDAQGTSGPTIFNGADDNAAAVAMALGVGCAIAENAPKRSVIVAAWDAEEPPTFLTDAMGSAFYVANPVIPLAQTDASLVYELVGSSTWGTYQGTFVFGAELSPQLAAAFDQTPVPDGLIARRAGLHLFEERPTGHLPLSDYDAFRDAGIPTFMATNGPTNRYHTGGDTADTLDYPKMSRVAEFQLNIAWRLIQGTEQPVFVADGNDYLHDARMMESLLQDAILPGAYVDSQGFSPDMQAALEGDLAATTALKQKLEGGGTVTNDDLLALRAGVGRMICPLITSYPESVCIAAF